MLLTEAVIEAQGRVRPMARHDVPVAAGLIARLARHYDERPAIDAAGLEADLLAGAPAFHGLVAERFGYVVGYALMTPGEGASSAARTLELHQLFVIEGSRGLGLGRALVGSVMDVARETGCGLIVARAHVANIHARGFYGALGFQPRDGVATDFIMTLP